MAEKETSSGQVSDLRRRAEEILQARAAQAQAQDALSLEEERRALHELQVHQIELEMQNEELRRAQEELEASRARYFDLYDLAPIGYVTLSEPGLILEANLTAAKLLGVARSTLVKQPLTRFILPEDQDIYYRHRQQLFATSAPQVCELRLTRADGSSFWAWLEASVGQAAGGAPVFRTMLSDITERKQTEAQLHDYQRQLEVQNLELRKFSLAIEQSGSTIVITDTEGAIQYANPRFEETTGYTLREALGQTLHVLNSSEQNADDDRALWETIASGQIWRGEFHSRRKDGTLYWESATIAPVYNIAGQITHYIAIKEDVTERIQTQEALHRYAEQLAVQNAELDAFAHTVAHDLKTPIGIIAGFAEVLVDDHETMSTKDVGEALRHIFRTGKKLDTIIEELMLLTSVRKQEVAPQPLDMSSVVREAIEGMQMLIQDQRAQITLLDEAAWPVALGHAPWIEEVWANYISNAIKYGGCPPQIKVGADSLSTSSLAGEGKSEGVARFWVQDNGSGLSTAAQMDLFTPFTRLEQVRAQGHGLGLSIVRRIVEKLGGQVGVESELGQGSTFFFTLPTFPIAR